jgi:hypothetical protein
MITSSRSSLLVCACLLAAACSDGPEPRAVDRTPAAAPAPSEHLRGFGALAVDRHEAIPADDCGSWITITAEDAAHAGLCAAKFLADATAIGPVREVAGDGLPATVLTLDRAGWWVLGVDGVRFQVLFAPTREALARRCAAVGHSRPRRQSAPL